LSAILANGALHLTWTPSAAADLWYYGVYRGATADFPPSAANLIGQPVAASWTDPGFQPNGGAYYKVIAVDRHGNASAAATLSPGQMIDSGHVSAPAVSFLGRVQPNPIQSSASIEYGIARAGRFKLAIYDLSGRCVRSLVEGTMAPGERSAHWDARDGSGQLLRSGAYWVRLTGEGIDRTRRIVLAR
jgi:hypothetical protein